MTESTIDGMLALHLENNLVRIGVLPDRGSDIFEFRYKPKNMDFLLRLKKGIRNPRTHFSQLRSTRTQFEDYYYGGWQVCLPNSPAFNYRGAELGQHGEVSLIPWETEVLEETNDRIVIRCIAEPLRFPVRIERTFSLLRDSTTLLIEEVLTNYSGTALDIMWGQHIAFGLPFLEQGGVVKTNAKTMMTEPSMPAHHRFKRDEIFGWPLAKSKDGQPTDASQVPARSAEQYSDLCYLEGYDGNAFYAIKNEIKNVGFALTWDGRLFKDLWFWQERNATKDFPWWGDCFTAALEPWTSRWTGDPQQAIDKGEWLKIEAGEKIKTILRATAFENDFDPK